MLLLDYQLVWFNFPLALTIYRPAQRQSTLANPPIASVLEGDASMVQLTFSSNLKRWSQQVILLCPF